ncbi:MAG: exosortase U [Planctomycetota bacterium]
MDGIFIAALLAHVPLGIEYARRMWRVGHYQFFPLLLIVAGWLIYSRVSKLPVIRQQSNLVFGLLAVNMVVLTLAVTLFSPFLWILSFIGLVCIFVYDEWGKPGIIEAFPALLLFLFVIPLPGNLDLKLINKMQFMASQLASWVLDAFGQMHFREGVVLITEQKQFFTEEACSGVRSLFSSLAAISIYGVMNQYPAWRHIFNLIQTVLWVIVGNALRIAIVVYVSDNFTESIASGTNHEMLGLGVFLFIFAISMSTDRALNAWQSETQNRSLENLVDDEEELATVGASPRTKSPRVKANPVVKWTLATLFGLLAIFALRLAWVKISGEMFVQFNKSTDLLASLETDLPKSIQGWNVVSFEHQMREDIRLLAPESYLWTFEKGGRQVKISLDSPYYDFHNLNDCYAGFGWDVDYSHDYAVGEATANAKNMTQLDMEKKNEYGKVLFTAYDRAGNLAIPRNDINLAPSGLEKITRNVRLALGLLNQDNDPRMSKQPLPISQVQLIYRSGTEIGETDDIESLFFEVREILRRTKRFQQASN